MSAGYLDELEEHAVEARESDRMSEAEGPFMLGESPAQEFSQPAEAMEQPYPGEAFPGEAYRQESEECSSCGHEAGEVQSLAAWHSETFPGAAELAGAQTSEYAPVSEYGEMPAAGGEASEYTPLQEYGETPAPAAELDPYLAIRPALSPEHAHLGSDEIALILGRRPAIVALHSLLGSRELRDAALAALLGSGGRRTVRVNAVDVPLAGYLRGLSRLAWEAAEHSLAETGETTAEAAAEFETPHAPRRAPNVVRGRAMSKLKSDLFAGDRALEAALHIDASHILRGTVGDHVKKIQTALTLLLADPPCDIGEAELIPGSYGQRTAAAVLRYKTERKIINFAYQTRPDDIVGKMTMRSLDDAMVVLESEYGAAMLGIIGHLDELLLRYAVTLSAEMRSRIEAIRAHALVLNQLRLLPGASPHFADEYRDGLRLMDDVASGQQAPTALVAVAPAVAAAGGIAVFLLAVGTLIGLIILSTVIVTESRKLGERINRALAETIAAGEAAILDNVGLVKNVRAAVDHCRAISLNPSPQCLDALKRFDAKVSEVVAKRIEFERAIQDLKNALGGSPRRSIP
jgi:hypothetical protein